MTKRRRRLPKCGRLIGTLDAEEVVAVYPHIKAIDERLRGDGFTLKKRVGAYRQKCGLVSITVVWRKREAGASVRISATERCELVEATGAA